MKGKIHAKDRSLFWDSGKFWRDALCEKCPNAEFCLFRVFPYLVRIRENTDHKKLRIWTLFTQWWFWTRAWCSKELLKWKYKGGRIIFPINNRFQCCNCIKKKTSGKFKKMFLKNYFFDLQINNECYLDLHRSEIFYKNFFHANRSWLAEKIKQNYRL